MSAPNGDIRSPTESRKQTVDNGEQVSNVTSLIGMYLLVAGAVSCSWMIGFLELSFVWSFMLITGLFIVWKAKISKIIKHHLNVEETVLHRRRAFRQNETAEWLNFLVNRWWVFSSYSIEQVIKKRLDERLWDIKPQFLDSLELTTFSVGEQTPVVRNVQVFENSEAVPGAQHKPISWFSVNNPPAGLDRMSTYQLVILCDLQMASEDFKMIFRARVGSKRVNVGFDMAVEELQVSGSLQAVLLMSMDAPFPHIAKATMSFQEKPDVTFNLRMMKALQMMEVPLLKSWIHTNVMEGLTKAMVDPSSLDLTLAKTGPVEISRKSSQQPLAQGVLTIHIKGSPPKEAAPEEVRYTVLRLGKSKRQTHDTPVSEEWDDVCTFFIHNLRKEEIVIKSKCRRLLTSTTMEQTTLNLSAFPFQVQSFAEKDIVHKDGSQLQLKMQYSALPVIDLNAAEVEKRKKVSEMAGVMYVCIHGASHVKAADKTGASDPYCILFCNRRRVLTTPYVLSTRNPRWESCVEFFVGNFTQSTYSFFVYDWDGSNTIDDDFLGVAHLNLKKEETSVVKHTLTLGYNRRDEGFTPDKTCGQITVSVIFRPVASVAKSERFRDLNSSFSGNEYLYKEDLMSPASVSGGKFCLPPSYLEDRLMRQDSEASDRRRSLSAAAYMDGILEDKLIAELTILQGKDLVSMDRNGFSDPFCIVSHDGKKVFTTSVKKKTLFPKWNELVTVEMKQGLESTLTIDVFDKDMISKEFMGKVTLTVEKLKELSIRGVSEWIPLERTKSGKLQLKCQVISRDTLKTGMEPVDEVFDASEPSRKISLAPGKKTSLPVLTLDTSLAQPQPPSASSSLPYKSRSAEERKPSARTPEEWQAQPRRPENSAPRLHHLDSLSPMGESSLRRSASDVNVDKSGYPPPADDGARYNSLPRQASPSRRRSAPAQAMKQTLSVNSVNIMQKDRSDTASINSSFSTSDKLFGVSGTVYRARGLSAEGEDVYCKIRFEQPGSRASLFSGSRVLGKSKSVPPSGPSFNVKFEVDRGHGVSPDALLIFDLKQSSKLHLATRSFSLREILAESEGVCKWLELENGIELEVSLSLSQASPRPRRRKIFKRFSFNRDK